MRLALVLLTFLTPASSPAQPVTTSPALQPADLIITHAHVVTMNATREVIPDGDQAGHAVEPFLFRLECFLYLSFICCYLLFILAFNRLLLGI